MVSSGTIVLTGRPKPAGKRPLGRPRRRWKDTIRTDFKEIGISMRNWADSAQEVDCLRALVNAALNFWVPYAIQLVMEELYSI